MKREIKFRGKTYRGEWIIGSLKDDRGHTSIGRRAFELNIPGEIADVPRKEESYWTSDYVNSVTVGQFTGLRDKNGTEIYEGDIIRRIARISFYGNNKASAHVVKFGEDGIYNGFYLEPQCDAFFVSHNSFIFEVIGNIHDNPELMKGGKQ